MSRDASNPSRRTFIANVASGASAIAAVGLSATTVLAQGAASPAAQGEWDLSWLDRVQRAKHKIVFDSPAIGDGMALNNAVTWLNGYREVYQTTDADMAAVVVFRHKGLPVALNDDMWARLKLGEDEKVKDSATGETAMRNPFASVKPDDKNPPVMPGAGVDGLIARGVIVLACNLALMRHAGPLAKAEGISREQAQQALIASVLPGVIRMPSGVFATSRAEEAGCVFLRST